MPIHRCLLELGTGVDLHGKDPTKAAKRAVFDALRHSSLAFPRVFGYEPQMMYVEVNIAVPYPEMVKQEEVLSEVPYGQKKINVLDGGMEIKSSGQSNDSTIMANAAIIVSLDIKDIIS